MKQFVGGKDGVGEGIISQVFSHFLLNFGYNVSPSLHSLYCIDPGHTLITTQKVRSYPL